MPSLARVFTVYLHEEWMPTNASTKIGSATPTGWQQNTCLKFKNKIGTITRDGLFVPLAGYKAVI